MSEDDFGESALRESPIAGFGMEWSAVIGCSSALLICQKRFTDVTERDRLEVFE